LTQQLIFETSNDTSVVDYYAPNDVLVVKGGAGIDAYLGLRNGNELALGYRLDAGLYVDDLTSAESGSLNLETEARVEYTKGDSTFYASVFASGTLGAPYSSFEYWFASATFGISAEIPRLLSE
jgi:hypothetical protein